MKPWEVWTWKFPDAGEHPAVLLGTEERVRLKPRVRHPLLDAAGHSQA